MRNNRKRKPIPRREITFDETDRFFFCLGIVANIILILASIYKLCQPYLDTTVAKANINNYYAMTAIVSYVDEYADEVNCVDVNGNEWVFTGVEDWCAGDVCSMMMYNNGTRDNIYDDEIVSCRYGGTFE